MTATEYELAVAQAEHGFALLAMAQRILASEQRRLERCSGVSKCCGLPLRYRGTGLGWTCTGCGQPQ